MLGLYCMYNEVTLFEARYEVHTLSIQTMLSDDEIPSYPLSQTSFRFIYRALMKIKRQNITQKNYFYVFNFDNFFYKNPISYSWTVSKTLSADFTAECSGS